MLGVGDSWTCSPLEEEVRCGYGSILPDAGSSTGSSLARCGAETGVVPPPRDSGSFGRTMHVEEKIEGRGAIRRRRPTPIPLVVSVMGVVVLGVVVVVVVLGDLGAAAGVVKPLPVVVVVVEDGNGLPGSSICIVVDALGVVLAVVLVVVRMVGAVVAVLSNENDEDAHGEVCE